ncbi:hypothetical protein MHYP_G00093130 [Metynnis hypsauchen]
MEVRWSSRLLGRSKSEVQEGDNVNHSKLQTSSTLIKAFTPRAKIQSRAHRTSQWFIFNKHLRKVIMVKDTVRVSVSECASQRVISLIPPPTATDINAQSRLTLNLLSRISRQLPQGCLSFHAGQALVLFMSETVKTYSDVTYPLLTQALRRDIFKGLNPSAVPWRHSMCSLCSQKLGDKSSVRGSRRAWPLTDKPAV